MIQEIKYFNIFDEIFEKDENRNVVRGKEIKELDIKKYYSGIK